MLSRSGRRLLVIGTKLLGGTQIRLTCECTRSRIDAGTIMKSQNQSGYAVTSWHRLLMIAFIFCAQFGQLEAAGPSSEDTQPVLPSVDIVDTVLVEGATYIVIDRARQMLQQYHRDGRIDTHYCSTGNPKRRRAIATPLGVFRVASKSLRHISSIFHVMMTYWMPFNHGVGIHGLNDTSYYKNLGVAPSSAGCVRVSNESARSLYASTPVGTIVYVHDGYPRRVLLFVTSKQGA